MASRNTLEKAQELKNEMEQRHPNATIRIVEERTGYWIGEVRKCRECGGEILTAAVGEWGNDECRECAATGRTRWDAKVARGVEASRQAVAEHMAFDEYSESNR